MQIPLSHFEQVIDEKILERGLSYYKKGLVRQLDEVSPNHYEAVVEGTEDYTVQLTIENDVVTEYVCDCPYDQGPVCKHMAAVLFKLMEEPLQLNQKQTKTKSKANTKTTTGKKRKTIAEQIDEMLSKASKEELIQLVKEETVSNKVFRNRIMMTLEQYNDDISKEFYAKQIKSILRSAKSRYGFVDWQSSKTMGRALDQLLDAAQKAVDRKNYQNALCICFAVMEELIPALNEIDDSSGEIGDRITIAYELLCEMGCDIDSKTLSKSIFDFCVHHFENKTFKGWDWHIDVLWLAVAVASTSEELDRLWVLVEQEPKHNIDDFSGRYEEQQMQLVKYRLLVKTKGDAEAETFLKQNLENSELRRIAIENAINRSDYSTAISIAKDGVKQDMKQRPGLAMEWYDWLLKIALKQNDTASIIEYARLLMIDDFHHGQDYYQILKNHVKPEQWNDFVDQLIKDVQVKGKGYRSNLVAQILIKEKRWDQLWVLVSELPFLQSIEQYETYFSKRYPERLSELYAKRILEYMDHNMGRDHYQNACRYIRKIIKLGERTKADEVMKTLRERYPNRRALMEELEKV